MLNRPHTYGKAERIPPGERRRYRQQNPEIISLTLDFWREALLLRTPRSVESLDHLIQGFDTYTNYRPTGRGPVGRTLVRSLDLAYRVAARRLESVRTSARYVDRCERAALELFRQRQWGEPDHETVLFTLTFTCDWYYEAGSELVRTLTKRYRLAGSSGTALLAAPRWFYQLMLVLWPAVRWGRKEGAETREEILAAAIHAGMSREYAVDGVDLDALVLLWDDDPLQLYFGLDDVLPALAHL